MIEIIRTGSQVCIVDTGRYKYRRYGVPVSGAMDRRSAARANSLLHNRLDCAVIEMYMPGHELLFRSETKISLAGAETVVFLEERRIYTDRSYLVPAGTTLSIGAMSRGCRIYLAIQEGIQSSLILGSRSPIPGFLNRRLTKGDKIDCNSSSTDPPLSSSISSLAIETKKKIMCHVGPEWGMLSEKNKKLVCASTFYIDHHSDRMGYRLHGSPLHAKNLEIYSSAVMPGTVQLPPNGLPILLMRDCQTTGGYPRILQIAEEDINQIAQRRPGDEIQFELIDS